MLPIHNHSEYSALDGYSKPAEIAARIKELGLPGAFLTDHGTVAGFSKFRKAMHSAGLFAGYGMEAYQAEWSRKETKSRDTGELFKMGKDQFHLILLAKNKEGYLNLLRLSDEANRTGFYYKPRVDWELLKQYSEGLFATSACLGSLVNKKLVVDDWTPMEKMLNIFGDDFLIELHTYDADFQRDVNKALVEFGQERGLRFVYANDAHYAWPEDYNVHEALLCAQYGEKLDGEKKYGGLIHHPPCLYIMPETDVREALNHLPDSIIEEAIETSDWLMEQCLFELDKPTLHLPKATDEGDSVDKLITLVEDGIKSLYGDSNDEAWDRAEYELESVIGAGLHDYFLIVHDYIHYAIRHGKLVGPGRGSVGGSIIAYALGITSIDPLKYGLQFERFWNPGREAGLPDIDIDFEKDARQFMIDYVERKYGVEKVLRIGNHMFMGPKMAIDKAGAVLYDSPPYSDMKKINKIIQTTTDAGQTKNWEEVMEEVGDELAEYEVRWPEMFALAEDLSGRLHTYGIHASAVVISDVDLADYLPARMASDDDKKKVIVTQAEMHEVEDEGFPKFDFLGLRNLDTIMLTAIMSGDFGPDSRETRKKIIKHFREDVDYNALDDSYYEMIDEGHTLGLFQIDESRTPRGIGKAIQPRNIEDLAAIVALNRPGPLRGGVVEKYQDRRRDKADFNYPDDILIDILQPTYGEFLYQEQVIDYFKAIGYSLSDADYIRKILGKKLVEEMRAEQVRYLERATNFMSEQKARAIWEKIEDFSKYSFNKAHAVGYGMILAWTLYAKTKWPTAFIMASIMTNPKKVGAYINEARRINVKVLPPDVNRSMAFITLDGEDIVYGLRDIKGIGNQTAQWIVDNQPYSAPEDFLEKQMSAKKPPCNIGHFKKIMEAGAFDEFGYRMGVCDTCDGRGRYRPDPTVRKLSECLDCVAGWTQAALPDIKEKVKAEELLLGVVLTDAYAKLVDNNKERLAGLAPLSSVDVDVSTTVKVPGIIKTVTKTKTKATGYKPNRDMAMVTIAWEGEEATFAAFPDQYDEYKFMLRPHTLGEFTLKTGKKGASLKKGYKLNDGN